MMINRVLYKLVAAALLGVFVFDQNFSSNLSRALGEPLAALRLDSWEVWMCGIFAALVVAAIYRERRRS
jgi:hypothetical protein